MRKKILWDPAARADLRRLDREVAMRILLALTRYSHTGEGDVKMLIEREGLYRLRVGKWRVFLTLDAADTIRIRVLTTAGKHIEAFQPSPIASGQINRPVSGMRRGEAGG
jgi:mRNA-degrading endonuclease RelE of RelBE toxin-antitoxin system